MRLRPSTAIGALLLIFPVAAGACLWDSDTLAAEAKGLPKVVDVITGRFDRNPPLYYQLRLRRAKADLDNNPSNLEAFDDQAVACDRLGLGLEAIRLMEGKRQVLDRLPPDDPRTKEHRYRYLANLGTFYAHHWFREGADRKRPQMLLRGRELIRQAIKLNPDAHFGREKYQLRAIEWILSPKGKPNLLGVELHEHGIEPTGQLAMAEMGDAVQGHSGLIVLGNAWESIDVYEVLAAALKPEGHSSKAFLAYLRCAELPESGKHSLLPDRAPGSELPGVFRRMHDSLMDGEVPKLRVE